MSFHSWIPLQTTEHQNINNQFNCSFYGPCQSKPNVSKSPKPSCLSEVADLFLVTSSCAENQAPKWRRTQESMGHYILLLTWRVTCQNVGHLSFHWRSEGTQQQGCQQRQRWQKLGFCTKRESLSDWVNEKRKTRRKCEPQAAQHSLRVETMMHCWWSSSDADNSHCQKMLPGLRHKWTFYILQAGGGFPILSFITWVKHPVQWATNSGPCRNFYFLYCFLVVIIITLILKNQTFTVVFTVCHLSKNLGIS